MRSLMRFFQVGWFPCLLLLAVAAGCRSGAVSGEELLRIRPDERDPAWVSVHLSGAAARRLRDRMPWRPVRADAEPYFFFARAEQSDKPLPVRFHVMGEELQLVPEAPLDAGRSYVAVFRGSRVAPGLQDLTREYAVPRP